MRRHFVAGAAGLALLFTSNAAIAQDTPGSGYGDDDAGVTPDGSVDGVGEMTVTLFAPGSEAQPAIYVAFDSAGNPVITSNVVPVRVRELDYVPPADRNDEPHHFGSCIRTYTVLVIEGQEEATRASYEEALRFALNAFNNSRPGQVPDCVYDDAVSTDAVEAFEDMLGPFVRDLPRPTPVISPETAITGLDTYLQTNRPLAYGPVAGHIDLGGTLYPVQLWAEGAYNVDWGQEDDGEGVAFDRVTGPHTIPGRNYDPERSWDDEAVTHVYTSTPGDTLRLSVTDYWIIHYSIAGVVTDATITAELEPVTVPVEVNEYQAVVVDQ